MRKYKGWFFVCQTENQGTGSSVQGARGKQETNRVLCIYCYNFDIILVQYKIETMHTETAKSKGISLMEVIIAVSLIAMIAAVLSPIFTGVNRAWDKDRRLKEQVQQSRDAMDFIIYELKKTNAMIDGTSANFATTAALDPRYVVFATAGDEIYLDDKNSGYTTNGVAGFTAGTKPGGFAGDYDETSAGYATYSYTFATLLPGDYDIYAYYIVTSAVMRLNLFDDSTLDYNTTYDQSGIRFTTTSAGGSWDQLNRSNPTTRSALNLTGVSGAIGVTKSSGTANAHADGFKLVYQGFRHKVFSFQAATNKITFGSDAFGFAGLANNPALLNNVQQINAGTPIFSYYQANGVTAATSASNVSLVRIQFQISDPDGKVPPYPLRAQAEVRSATTGSASASQTRVVINEVNYNPSAITYYSDDMDGNVIVNNIDIAGYPNYSTYNNWFANFDANEGWVSTNGTTLAPWARGAQEAFPGSAFDASGTSIIGTNVGGGGSYAKNTSERYASPLIAFPATPVGTLYWRSYYVYQTNDSGDVLSWQAASTAGWATLGVDDANAGADQKNWTLKESGGLGLNIDAHAGKTGRIGLLFTDDGNPQGNGAFLANSVIFSSTTTETMNMITYRDIANGRRTLWARGRPDTAKTSSAPATAHPACRSGTMCWGTSSRDNSTEATAQSYNYPEMVNGSFETPDDGGTTYYIDLTTAASPTLSYWYVMDTVTTDNPVNTDGGIVEVCKQADACFGSPTGAGWTKLTNATHTLTPDYTCNTLTGGDEQPLGAQTAYCTDVAAWTQVTASLANFTGGRVKVRWHFGSDKLGGCQPAGGCGGPSTFDDGHSWGWYIDDIKVVEGCAEEWIELYNPHPYPVKVTDDAATCRETGGFVCNTAETWRVVLHTHKSTADTYDMIAQYSGDTRYEIPAFGYAVIAKSTTLYTDSICTSSYPVPSTAVRLLIDDSSFGASGLPNEFGLVQIRDENDNLVDQVNYNVAMYDDFETASTSSQWNTDSTGATTWSRGQLAGADGMADNNDHTNNDVSQGYVFGTNMGANYANAALNAHLYDPVVDLTLATTTVTLSFWHEYKLNTGESIVVRQSTDGGSSWADLGATISGAATQTTWLNATRTPTNQSVTLLRFRFTSNADGNVDTGWYVDDVAVYWNWGGNGNQRTLQRVNWAASSTAKKNWCESQNNNGSPGSANNPAVCY